MRDWTCRGTEEYALIERKKCNYNRVSKPTHVLEMSRMHEVPCPIIYLRKGEVQRFVIPSSAFPYFLK